jgi:hypothetical protein
MIISTQVCCQPLKNKVIEIVINTVLYTKCTLKSRKRNIYFFLRELSTSKLWITHEVMDKCIMPQHHRLQPSPKGVRNLPQIFYARDALGIHHGPLRQQRLKFLQNHK